jgi:hypothetical protein
VFTGSYIAHYAYTCNPTTNTYTVTIPGSYLAESSCKYYNSPARI